MFLQVDIFCIKVQSNPSLLKMRKSLFMDRRRVFGAGLACSCHVRLHLLHRRAYVGLMHRVDVLMKVRLSCLMGRSGVRRESFKKFGVVELAELRLSLRALS